jgi:site-specific DNA-methyltransferase (adenine-specific)
MKRHGSVLCSATRRAAGIGAANHKDRDRQLPARPAPIAQSASLVIGPGPTSAAGAQLALDLPGLASDALPALALAPEWKDQQRLWGHRLHPMCSYLASFPAALTHAFIARYSRPGDVVLDPFSGRGTTPLQACAEGRVGIGNDLNPFAHLLTASKVDPATEAEARTRVAALRLRWAGEAEAWLTLSLRVLGASGTGGAMVPLAGSGLRPGDQGAEAESVPIEVALCFAPRTFAQLLFVRSTLRLDDRVDRFLAAAITGILHGKSATYLSEVMPNTFSMAPRYVRDFVARTDFQSPERDVFHCLEAKLSRLYREPLPPVRGIALLGDARDAGARSQAALRARGLPDRARLVVTSPPYLRVVKYGYYNWLRTWFLGFDAAAIDAALDDAHHKTAYLRFMADVLTGLRPALADDAVVVLVIGDVEADRGRRISNGIGLAGAVWEAAAAPAGYRLAGIALDDVHAGRKMTKLWGDEAGQATKLDRILVLGASEAGRRRAVNGASLPVDWDWPPRRLRAL